MQSAGCEVTLCGAIPTPALALAASEAGCGAIMVTGSHIPADRNGLKFYTPTGEVTKSDEVSIIAAMTDVVKLGNGPPIKINLDAAAPYIARYLSAYQGALSGLRIGIYEHSAVGRDLLTKLLRDLGADVVPLGRADQFIPIDTEAVSEPLRRQLRAWAVAEALDAIVSTDADGDRPLLTDADGQVVPGDVLGQIAAQAVGAKTVVTPVSSNSSVAQMPCFNSVIRTKIGSPHVIAAMQDAGGDVAGYEANGGFLLGFAAQGPSAPLPALMTRDAVLPLLTVLSQASADCVGALVAAQPARFTAADRLQHIDLAAANAWLDQLIQVTDVRTAFLGVFETQLQTLDLTDGARMILVDGRVIHLRPSGNAPELRIYVEANAPTVATKTLAMARDVVATQLAK